MITGDHVMDGSTVVISPPDGDMADYRASIDRLREWSPALRVLAPAHGQLIEREGVVSAQDPDDPENRWFAG